MQKLKDWINQFVINRIPEQESEWVFKGYTLFFILLLLTVFGGIAILPSVFSAIQEGKLLGITILIGAYLIIPILLFVKNINYTLRSYLFCIAMFIAGYIVIGHSPLISSARLWFLCTTALACLLINGRTAFVFFLGSVLVILSAGYETNFTINLPVEPGHVIWVITMFTFVLINIIVVSAIYLIVYGLKRSETIIKQAEEDLRQQLEFSESLIETAQTIILVLDLQGRIIRFNRFMEELTGYELDEVKGKDWFEIFIKSENGNTVKSIFEKATHCVQNRGHVNQIITKNGQQIIIEWYDTNLKDKDGNTEGVLAIGYDITEHKKIQDRLNQSQKLESVGRLAGGVAHDFNNMLNIILGHSELALLILDKDDKLWNSIKEIHSAGERSANMTKQLLGYARKQNVSPKIIDLNSVVNEILKMIKRLVGEQIEIVWEPVNNLWSIKIDPSQLDQILINLCVNSRDAIDQTGKIVIETGMKTFDQEYCLKNPEFVQGDFVLLSVSDNGCGMDKDILENLFEPFFTTKSVGGGTGLGLSTVYGIIKQNNGFINVYSEPNQGTTINIYLPRWVGQYDSFTNESNNKEIVAGTETILLVEDEIKILELTEITLQELGYTILSTISPNKAIDIVNNYSDKIDLLITDVIMPEMNGKELFDQITKIYPNIKPIFTSGYTSNIIAHQGILDDDVVFIQKPFSRVDLDNKIREVLD